jgi:ankyrin repeat protein
MMPEFGKGIGMSDARESLMRERRTCPPSGMLLGTPARLWFGFLIVLICSAPGARARAQDTEEYERVVQLGLDALEAQRFDEGIAAFRRCLELRPRDQLCAYNLACAYSLKRDVRNALDWLARSIEWGFSDLQHMESDADLENVRAEARYRSLVARMQGDPDPAIPGSAVEDASHLVVMVDGRLGGAATLGAGIVFGRKDDTLYVATARHVVRRGELEATDLRLRLRTQPDELLPARVAAHSDASLDLAVLAARIPQTGFRYCAALPMDRLAAGDELARGDAVFPVGYPNGAPWGMPVAPDRVAQLVSDEITFQSAFIHVGHSGGGLITDQGTLVGMIRADTPPFGVALSMARVLQALRQWGYPVHLRSPRNFFKTPLHEAIERRDIVEARRLVEGCAFVNTMNDSGRTPLHLAASLGLVEVARLLLDAGAEVDARTRDAPYAEGLRSQTPLHLAAESGSAEVAELLLSRGADMEAEADDFAGRDWKGTPLHQAAASGATGVIDVLVRHGADKDAASIDGTPLNWAVLNRQLEAIRLLAERGADVNAKAGGELPLYTAAEAGAEDVTKLLLERGANPDVLGTFGAPLHRAARHGFVNVVRLLLQARANPNIKGTWGGTPLHEAAKEGHLGVVRALLDGRADPKLENEAHETPLHLARRGQHADVVAYLSSRGGRD